MFSKLQKHHLKIYCYKKMHNTVKFTTTTNLSLGVSSSWSSRARWLDLCFLWSFSGIMWYYLILCYIMWCYHAIFSVDCVVAVCLMCLMSYILVCSYAEYFKCSNGFLFMMLTKNALLINANYVLMMTLIIKLSWLL